MDPAAARIWLRSFASVMEAFRADAPAIFKACRKDLGLTQKQMASRLNITNIWLCNIERGVVKPSVDLVDALARIMANGGRA